MEGSGVILMQNIITIVTTIIGGLGIALGFISLAKLLSENGLETAISNILLGHSGAPYSLALILGGAAVLAISVVADTLISQES